MSQFPKNGCLVFCDINSSQKKLKIFLSKKFDGPVCILVGPEGDFSESERKIIIDLKEITKDKIFTKIFLNKSKLLLSETNPRGSPI